METLRGWEDARTEPRVSGGKKVGVCLSTEQEKGNVQNGFILIIVLSNINMF